MGDMDGTSVHREARPLGNFTWEYALCDETATPAAGFGDFLVSDSSFNIHVLHAVGLVIY